MSGPQRLGPAELARAIEICRAASPHTVPLFEAAACGAISLLSVTRAHPAALGLLPATAPALVLIPDDGETRTGPAGWASAERLARWAAAAFIHGAGGDVRTYRQAVVATISARRLVLVECGSAHLMAWHRLFAQAGKPTVNIIPEPGTVHPVTHAADTLH